jgi:small basic protein (TIGR04137 family)
MSVDRSLKIKGALKRHRNVLTRAERVEKLKDEERWTESESLFGLPKVAHRKSHAGRKAAKEEAAVEGAVAATPEAQAQAGAKPATPTAGAIPTKTAAGATPTKVAATPLKEKPKEKSKGKGKEKS